MSRREIRRRTTRARAWRPRASSHAAPQFLKEREVREPRGRDPERSLRLRPHNRPGDVRQLRNDDIDGCAARLRSWHGTDDCGRTSATSRPSTLASPPSTGPSDKRGRRSSAFVHEDCRGAIPRRYRNYTYRLSENFVSRCDQWLRASKISSTNAETNRSAFCQPAGVDRMVTDAPSQTVCHGRIAGQQPRTGDP